VFITVIGTARIIWGGSMKRYGVRPSVCLIRPLQYIACGGFAAVGPVGRTYRSIAAAAACGGGHAYVAR